jgi:hypothetical protein
MFCDDKFIIFVGHLYLEDWKENRQFFIFFFQKKKNQRN